MKTWLVLSFLALAACARPDYVEPKANTPSGQAGQSEDKPQNPTTEIPACDLKLANEKLCASIEWTHGPVTGAESEFILKFKTDDTAKVLQDPSQSLSVVLMMPSMGHGSSPVKIERLEAGVFRVHKVYFIMGGDWEVRIFIKDQGRIVDQATLSLIL